ncbi:MAG: hypothetical protein J1G30_06985 [Spirochaetales bacterium]|nr:hypothetical protein [Spirochaetales bacterium]
MKILSRLWIIFTIALVFGCEFGEEENSDSKNSLTEGEWTDGKISKDGLIKKYTFTVSEWTRYFIFMNNAWNGDDKKSAYTGIKISHSDGTTISSSYSNVTSCYTKPVTFLSTSSGTITITLACNSSSSGWSSNWEKGTGTYAIKYTSRQEYTTLSNADEWHDDNIIANGQTNRYYIPVDGGRRYFVYMNNAWDGDDTKSAYTGIRATHSDNTIISSSYGNVTSCYTKPLTFVSANSGTVTMIMACNSSSSGWSNDWGKGIGTYAIKYNSRPEYITLSENEWHEDDILTNVQTNKYYISVTEGTRYNIYINDAWNGDGTKKAYIGLTIKYTQDSNASNPTICSSYSNAMKLYDKPYTFTASGTGTIIITAACNSSSSGRFSDWEKGTGTYAIRILSVTD